MTNAKSPTAILAVDDDDLNLKLLSYTLSGAGHLVRTALSGAEALTSVAQHPPDLILLDVMMPGMCGYEVLSVLKSQESTRSIPVIMLTSLEDEDSRTKGIALGAAQFLSKPTRRVELLAAIAALLKRA